MKTIAVCGIKKKKEKKEQKLKEQKLTVTKQLKNELSATNIMLLVFRLLTGR